MVVKIDFDNINDEIVYEAFQVDGREAEALSDSYLELYEIIGRDAMPNIIMGIRSTVRCGYTVRSLSLTLRNRKRAGMNGPRSQEPGDIQQR